jgi:Tfp pilus assembly protein PilF
MDGRWKRCLAGGLVVAAVGCNTTPKQVTPDGQSVQQPVPTVAQLAKTPPPPPSVPRANLKPETYATMGALKDQAADEVDRPQAERDAYRQQARQSYLKAIEVDPKYTPAYVALAKSYASTDEKDKSKAMFVKAFALAPNDAGIWYEYGAAQARAKDFPAAVKSLAHAVQIDPSNKAAQKLYGFTLARGGWYEESLNVLVKCMPEAEARYNLARMMQHNHQGDAAGVQLRLAAQMEPGSEPARAALASMPPVDRGVQQASYQAPAPAAPPVAQPQPAPAAAPQRSTSPWLPPVMLGGSE